MCGIFGIVSSSGVDPNALWFGTHRAYHRGPDDWGFAAFAPINGTQPKHQVWRSSAERWVAQKYRVGLGSRRLSILDLSEAGRQPMNLGGSNLWIVFNGEIYNYLELRTELSAEYCFSTQTDTEVLLAAYQKWGSGCLRHFNGMFAFAIYDAARMRLFMARDRFGERPFYYLIEKGQFTFASEIKQFFDCPYFGREVDRSALADFLLLSVQDHDERTFLKDIKQLRPAHWMELDLSTLQLHAPVRYWTPEIADDLDQSHDRELEQSLGAILADSVRLRMKSDVRVGICLSGGIDSSTIASIAASLDSSALSAYTMGFPGHPEDESNLARCMAKRSGIRYVEASFDAGDLWEGLDKFVYMQDGPVGGASLFASGKVFRAARNDGTTVLLNGQGCDEYFAGYSKFFFFLWEVLFARWHWLRLGGSLANYGARNGLIHWNFANARRYFPRPLRRRVGGIYQFASSNFQREAAPDLAIGHGDSLNRRLWKDLSEFSLPCLLHWEDRNSMAAGTEARLPFLDYRLVEAVLKTSVYTKLRSGFTKYSLRKTMSAQLPDEICWEKLKRGFETPARQWFRHDLEEQIKGLLSRNDSPLAELFDVKAIVGRFRMASSAGDTCLTEFDWFKLATTDVWLRQLQHVSQMEEVILSA